MVYRLSNVTELMDCVAQVLAPSPTKTFDAVVRGSGDYLSVSANAGFYSKPVFDDFARLVQDTYGSMSVPMVIQYEDINSYGEHDWPTSILLFPELMKKEDISKVWDVYVSVFDTSAATIKAMGNRQKFAMLDAGDIATGVQLRENWFRWDLTLEEVEAHLGY